MKRSTAPEMAAVLEAVSRSPHLAGIVRRMCYELDVLRNLEKTIKDATKSADLCPDFPQG